MEKVAEYIEANRERFLEELKTFIRFPSVSAQPEHKQDMIDCAQWLVDHLAGIGLEAKLIKGDGHPIVWALAKGSSDRRLIIYGHYDVQPEDPLDEWKSPPFEPEVREGNLYARGATDDKGQVFAHIKAVEAYLKTGQALGGDVLFLIEGEEENGGTVLSKYIKREKVNLAEGAVGIVVSDSEMLNENTPAITYALRGTVALEIELQGPNRDLHSGQFGGAVGNPAIALAALISGCIQTNGEITIPGFTDSVLPLADWEKENLSKLPSEDEQLKTDLGVKSLFGSSEVTSLEKMWAQPTFEVNGIYGGYMAKGSKTIIPASAGAKITMRLVPGQEPEEIGKLVKQHLQHLCPDFVEMTIREVYATEAVLFDIDIPLIQSACAALRAGFGHEAAYIRCGGSIPVVSTFWQELGKPVALMGFGLTSNGAHSPNECFSIETFHRAIRSSTQLMWNIPSG
jgi:acetylornithine deacetylase/succinyl-diaminopimelate desuccinylase-like protein